MTVSDLTLSRFQILEGCPVSAPGKCVVCGTTESARYIDFGFELDFYGVVYICIDSCFTELATILEYASPGQARNMKQAYADLKDSHDSLFEYNQELKDAVAALTKLRVDSGDVSGNSSTDSDQLVLDLSEQEEPDASTGSDEVSDPVVPERTRKNSGRKERSVKQDDESGSSDVHHDDSLNEVENIGDSI